MKSSEECYSAFVHLKADLPTYPLQSQTEADTRARLIDRMLTEVLDWSGGHVNREENAHPGFMDYVLVLNRRVAVLEAKRTGETFHLPPDIASGKLFTLNGIIRKVRNLQAYIAKVAKIVGWSPATMVPMAARYGHFSLNELRGAVESISGAEIQPESPVFSPVSESSSEKDRAN